MRDEFDTNAKIVLGPVEAASGSTVALSSRGMIWTPDDEGNWAERLMAGVFRPLHVWVLDPDVVTVDQVHIGTRLYLASPIPARYLSAGPVISLGLIRPYDNVEVRCSVARTTVLHVELLGRLHQAVDIGN